MLNARYAPKYDYVYFCFHLGHKYRGGKKCVACKFKAQQFVLLCLSFPSNSIDFMVTYVNIIFFFSCLLSKLMWRHSVERATPYTCVYLPYTNAVRTQKHKLIGQKWKERKKHPIKCKPYCAIAFNARHKSL